MASSRKGVRGIKLPAGWRAGQRRSAAAMTRAWRGNDMATQTFDDRDGWIWMNGKLVPWRDAKVHVLTHALHYASAVFEGERAYGGKVFKLREHNQRLIDS